MRQERAPGRSGASPATRIFLLFVTVASLPWLPPTAILVATAAFALAMPLFARPLRARIVNGVWRVRWLVAAIVVLYAWGGVVPWLEVGARVGVLVCAVAAVQLALYGMSARELADGLIRALSPLAWLGVPTAAFAHRLVATLDAVPAVQALIAGSRAPATGSPLARLAARAADVIAQIEAMEEAPA